MNREQKEWVEENLKCCPIDATFKIVGKKFTILILRNMMNFDHTRFNQLLNNIDGINPKTLSIRLREMETDGLIRRTVYDEVPVRIKYGLTEKGKALEPILEQMAMFSLKYEAGDVFRDGKPRDFRDVFGDTMKLAP